MAEPLRMPAGVSIERVDWLPSGARSGLVRVRGRRAEGAPTELPVLALTRPGAPPQRFASLPDPRAEHDPAAWRGAYVVDAALASAADVWQLEWPGGAVVALDKPAVEPPPGATAPPVEEPAAGGEVVDRAVLAERRARRAEAAEQTQARAAREALRAVEVLELRANEVEQRLAAAEAERDALRDRPEPEPPDPGLVAEVEALRAEVARLAAAPEPEPAPAPLPAADPVVLREALAATVAVVADLRLQLHKAQLARRSREVGWSADAVKLIVFEREREALREALAATEAELASARAAAVTAATALEEARETAAGAEAAHDETRRRFTERVAELAAARERIAELEAERQVVADAVRAEAAAAADARIADAQAATVAALDRAERAEDAVADALIARELAEAEAAVARAERRAAEVARAATTAPEPPARGLDLGGALGAAAGRLREVAPPPEVDQSPRPVPLPGVVASGAAEQAGRAARREPNGEDAPKLAADLDAAAEALRRRATIVSAPTDPPGDLARGQGAREYPPLRGALVKLAHDDPRAAARLIAGLLGATHVALTDCSFDLALDGAGTFAVAAGAGETTVTPLDHPRGRPHAAFLLRADGITTAELLAGVGPKPGRRGAARASGRVRRARAAARAIASSRAGVRELLAAGAAPDPLLALRCLAYAVHPSATAGLDACVEVTGPAGDALYACVDGGGLQVSPEAPSRPANARLRLGPDGVAAVLGEGELDADGDLAAVAALRGLALRAAGA